MKKSEKTISVFLKKQHVFLFLLSIFLSLTAYTQNNGYTLKKEYGIKGKVKTVTSYMVTVSKYTIPADTLPFFGKSKMIFNKNGDLTSYSRMFNLPDYDFKSTSVYSGTGKNISYTETSRLNKAEQKKLAYKYEWEDDYHYKIMPKAGKEASVQYVALNPDFSIDKVVFTHENYHSEEQASYVYNDQKLEKISYKVQTTENGITTETEDLRVVISTDVYDNPTLLYFYEKAGNRVPKSVVFKYYEYY